MEFPFGETVTVVSAGPRYDSYSDSTSYDDWDHPTSVDIPGVAVAPGGSSEPTEAAREAVESDFDLYFPPDAAVNSSDRVTVRGLTCDVVGRPFAYRSPFTGWAPGLVVKAKIKEG